VALVRFALGTERDRADHESYTGLCLCALLRINSNVEVDALKNSPIRSVRLGLYNKAREVRALCVVGWIFFGLTTAVESLSASLASSMPRTIWTMLSVTKF
jgi:hypothetical protein